MWTCRSKDLDLPTIKWKTDRFQGDKRKLSMMGASRAIECKNHVVDTSTLTSIWSRCHRPDFCHRRRHLDAAVGRRKKGEGGERRGTLGHRVVKG